MIYRVVIRFVYEKLSFLVERGALADSPGQALDLALASARVDRSADWRAQIEPAYSKQDFSADALLLPLVGTSLRSVADYFS